MALTFRLALALTPGLLPACQREAYRAVPGGNPGEGKKAMLVYGCGACHTIPGVDGAHGNVGPPLTAFGLRGYIAGQVPNAAEDLVRWIMKPESIEPGTAMPDLGVKEADARNIAAYLYTLK